jgi:hypothetical protein
MLSAFDMDMGWIKSSPGRYWSNNPQFASIHVIFSKFVLHLSFLLVLRVHMATG